MVWMLLSAFSHYFFFFEKASCDKYYPLKTESPPGISLTDRADS